MIKTTSKEAYKELTMNANVKVQFVYESATELINDLRDDDENVVYVDDLVHDDYEDVRLITAYGNCYVVVVGSDTEDDIMLFCGSWDEYYEWLNLDLVATNNKFN